MKKIILLTIILFVCTNISFAQNHKIDSLQAALKAANDDTSKVNTLNDLAWELQSNKPDTSILLSTEALQLSEKIKWQLGIGSSDNRLGWFAYLKGNYILALERYSKALAICDELEKSGVTNKSQILNLKSKIIGNMGVDYMLQGDNPKAMEYYLKALEIMNELKDKSGVAKTLGHIGIVYMNQSDYPKALDYYFKALKIAEELGDKNVIAVTLGNIGSIYMSQGDYLKALDQYFRALKTAEELGDKQSKANNLGNIGLAYVYQGDYAKALECYFKALKMDEELGHKQGTEADISGIGIVYMQQGDYSKALDYDFRALKIAEELGDKQSQAIILGNIGIVYYEQGDYLKSLQYYFKALKMAEEIKDQNETGRCLGNIGLVYSEQGDYSKALDYSSKALKLKEESGDKNGIATTMGNIGGVYEKQNDYPKALDYYFKAYKMAEGIGDKDGIARHLGNIGNIYKEQGDYSKGLDYYFKALKMTEQLGDKRSQAINLVNIGEAYYKQNKLTEADKYLQDALKLAIEIGAVDLINSMNINLVDLYNKQGDWSKAVSYSYQSFQTSKSFLLTNLSALSESEKSTFINTVADYSNSFFSNAFFYKTVQDSSLKWLYDYQLFQRGIVLESSSGLASSVKKDTLLQPLWERFSAYKNIVGKEYLKPIDERKKNLAALEDSANNLEKDLLVKSASYRNWKERVNATWQDVQKHLAKDEASIEFVSFDLERDDKTDSILYAAMVLTSQMQYPKLVFLFEEKQLSGLLKNVSSANASGITNLYTAMRGIKVVSSSTGAGALQYGDSLYKLIWKPMMPYMKDIKTISYVPDGLLNKISMSAIPTPDGKPLSETYLLRQMASTRSVAFPADEPKSQPAVFFGGIDYTYTIPTDTAIQKDTISTSLIELASRGNRGGEFNYLEGTKEEAEGLSNLYKSKNYSYQLIEGKNATEKIFKQMEGKSPAVLHLATHGFFFPSPDKKETHAVGGESNYSLAEDPLLRSGLILAGGDYTWIHGTNPYEEEDGILTAYEISHLNLSTTDVVVLSACETGLGDIKGAEGVYGLQRAFKMAGVKYIIMSLWQVPDKETQEFMQTFYSKWLNGEKIRTAFQQTQREMAAKYEPYKWAAFVLVE